MEPLSNYAASFQLPAPASGRCYSRVLLSALMRQSASISVILFTGAFSNRRSSMSATESSLNRSFIGSPSNLTVQ